MYDEHANSRKKERKTTQRAAATLGCGEEHDALLHYLLLYGFGLSTNLCAGLRPSILAPHQRRRLLQSCAPLHRPRIPRRGRSAKKSETDRVDKGGAGAHPERKYTDFRVHGNGDRDSRGTEKKTRKKRMQVARSGLITRSETTRTEGERRARGCAAIPGRARRAAEGGPAMLLGWLGGSKKERWWPLESLGIGHLGWNRSIQGRRASH